MVFSAICRLTQDSAEARELLYEETEEDPVQDQPEQPAHVVEEQLQQQQPRRSTRVSRPPTNLEPTMTGQSHDSPMHMHLQIPEEECEEYDQHTAKCAVSLLQAWKE